MDAKCRDVFLNSKTGPVNWGNDFHKYTLYWEPGETIKFILFYNYLLTITLETNIL